MASAYRIERCSAEDMVELGEIMTAAFEADAIMKFCHPGTPHQTVLDNNIDGFRKAFVKPGRVHEKVVDIETGKIVAFSRWYFPHTYTDEEKASNEHLAIYNWEEPAGSNLDICREFFEKMFAGRNKHIKRDDMYFLDLLAVHPGYQRKGLGALLLERVTPIADKENRQIYLEASKKGHNLYLRHGWKRIDGMVIDTAPYGGPGPEPLEFMMRDPQPVKES